MTDVIILQKRCSNPECPHEGLQPVSNFYVRSGVPNPTKTGHYISECKDCMKRRVPTALHLPPDMPRANTEVLAIGYLKRNKIPAIPGKANLATDVDILAWGCVRVECKYSTIRPYNHYFTFNLTRRQKQRGLLADVVLLICDWGDRQTFHLFDPDDDVFYFKDGRRKGGVTFPPDRIEQAKHFQNRTVLTKALMDAAENRLELIEAARLEFASGL